jgi:hypothetical protein
MIRILRPYLYKVTLITFLCSISVSCSKDKTYQPEETILVTIDDRVTISKNEFIRRAEYTIRPPYCNGSNYLHKKIILNSLIAEKLMALEIPDSSALLQNTEFNAFLLGRLEQAMRQWMHYSDATRKVRIDSAELLAYFKNSGREYEIAYYTLPDTVLLQKWHEAVKRHPENFTSFFRNVYQDTVVPTRKLGWKDADHPDLLRRLFRDEVKKGQILEPVNISGNEFLVLQAAGWTDTKAITQSQVHNRLEMVKESLKRHRSSGIWSEVVGGIMQGKTVEFNEDVFWEITTIFYDIYFKSNEERRNSLKQQIWDLEENSTEALKAIDASRLLDKRFFNVGDESWTVADFREELMKHPLVFRNRKMPANAFGKEFRLAVVDLIRDIYVTRSAYQKGYDKVNVVKRNEKMWRDAMKALVHKRRILEATPAGDPLSKRQSGIVGARLISYVDSLQNKYEGRIKLNVEVFDTMQFSGVDLLVKQTKQPFQHVVPGFPVLTTDHYIDYIKPMQPTRD